MTVELDGAVFDDGQGRDDADEQLDRMHPRDLDRLLALHDRYQQRLYRYCLGRLRDPAAAEDAVQETFIRVAPHLARLSPAVAGAYLMVAASHVCTKEARRRVPLRRLDGMRDDGALAETASDPQVLALDHDTLRLAWDALSRRDQMLLIYRFAGFSYGEIGRRLAMSADAAKVAAGRARQRARDVLDGMIAVLLLPLQRWRARRRVLRDVRRLEVTVHGAGVVTRVMRLAAWITAAGAAAGATVLGVHALGSMRAPAAGDVRSIAGSAAAAPAVRATSTSATLDTVQVVSIAPAPGAARWVFASGAQMQGCVRECAALYRSDDQGGTWERQPAAGFAGGTLGAAAAADGHVVLYAATASGLQRSDDGGASFRTVAAVGGPIAVLPARAGGEPDVLIAARSTWIYHGAGGRLTPGPSLPAEVTVVVSAVPLNTGEALIAAQRVDPRDTTRVESVALRCPIGGVCRTVLAVPRTASLHLAVDPSRAWVAALGTQNIHVSVDGGQTFTMTRAVDAANGGALAWDSRPGSDDLVVVSASSGTTSVLRLHGGALDRAGGAASPLDGVAVLVALDNGRLLAATAAPAAGGRWGVRCSRDSGATWLDTC